LQVK
jgi:hypothetical protein